MKVLVINSGSSSLKFELIDMTNEKSIAKGLCERIGISNPIFTYKNLVKGVVVKDRPEPMENHKIAIDVVLKQLQDPENGVIRNVDEILVMEDGKIIERGTDSQLMSVDSKYRKFQNLYSVANEWRVNYEK